MNEALVPLLTAGIGLPVVVGVVVGVARWSVNRAAAEAAAAIAAVEAERRRRAAFEAARQHRRSVVSSRPVSRKELAR